MNNIIVLSGPSGSGKTTLIHKMMAKYSDIQFSISHTTRPKRENEIEGKDYYFINTERFEEKIRQNEFVEWARVHNNLYGTSIEGIKSKLDSGKDLLVDLDIQGAKSLHKEFPEAISILIVPPSLAILRQRLREREKKIDKEIQMRLDMAIEELKEYKMYDYIIVNNNLQEAFSILNSIYIAISSTTKNKKGFLDKLLGI